MKKIIQLSLIIFTITLLVNCTSMPLSYNLISTVPELNGKYQYKDSLMLKFQVADDETVEVTQYKPNKNGNFIPSSDEFDLKVFFTDIKHNGKIRHFMSVDCKSDATFQISTYITVEFSIKNENLLITNLNNSFIDFKLKSVDFDSSEKFKNFMQDNIANPDLFEDKKLLFIKRKA